MGSWCVITEGCLLFCFVFCFCLECLNNTDCKQVYSTCYNGMCKCKDELIKDEKTCKAGEDTVFLRLTDRIVSSLP